MIVISDFFFKDGFESGLKRLIGRGYDVYVIQTLTPEEREPTLSGDLRLVDIEDGDHAEVTVSKALLTYYQRNLTAYCHELKNFCARHGVTYVLAGTEDAVEKLVLNYLRRIHLLR